MEDPIKIKLEEYEEVLEFLVAKMVRMEGEIRALQFLMNPFELKAKMIGLRNKSNE